MKTSTVKAYSQVLGRFRTVNGLTVHQRFPHLSRTYWERGHPIGILWHYTAGCESGVFGRGTIGAQFNIDRQGNIFQSDPVTAATWHAYGASHYWIGIEHTALPGTCDVTEAQLEASAKLSAALITYIKNKWDVTVPLTHHADPTYEAGFKDHTDGTLDTWNSDGHVDRLVGWSWDTYLKKVREALAPKPHTPDRFHIAWTRDDGTPADKWTDKGGTDDFATAVLSHHADDPAPFVYTVTFDPKGEPA